MVTEKLAIFLVTTNYNITNHSIQERFQYSGKTISKYFHEVLNALVFIYTHYI